MNEKVLRITKGDIDGLIGLLIDNLSVFLLLISLNIYVVGMPAEIVFGRILPGAAVGLLGGNIYYTYMAGKLMKAEARSDVTALPGGISIVFVITYTLGILAPVAKLTGDPELAWRIGLAANLIGALICFVGAFIGPAVRRFLPTAAMVGPVAGLAVVYIAGAGLSDIFSDPIIGFSSLAIIVWGYLAKGKLPFRLPAGLMALLIGSVLAFFMGQTAVDMSGTGVHLPRFWLFSVGVQTFRDAGPYLAVIIPVGVLNFITTLNDVESAATAGDNYPIREAMLIDASASALSAVFGCCYPNCVFIGHPGYKRMEARTTYSLLCSVVLFALAVFGLFGAISFLIPMAAVTPILILIGIVNIEVAFTAVPKSHVAAVAVSLLPFVGEFAMEQIDAGLAAVGIEAPFSQEVLSSLAASGVNYQGFFAVAQGTILIAMILSSLLVFVTQRQMAKASLVTGMAALFSFTGLIHSSRLALNPNPQLTAAWLILTALCFLHWFFVGRLQKKESAAGNLREIA